MDDELARRLRPSYLEIPLKMARRKLRDVAIHVAHSRERILLTERGYLIACVVPLEDATLLTELERRLDGEAGLEAIRQWEQDGKRTVSANTLIARFGFRPLRARAFPVEIASTAEPDLASITKDHTSIALAIGKLGRHGMVRSALAERAVGEVYGVRIEDYRAIFLLEEARLVVLRVSSVSMLGMIL